MDQTHHAPLSAKARNCVQIESSWFDQDVRSLRSSPTGETTSIHEEISRQPLPVPRRPIFGDQAAEARFATSPIKHCTGVPAALKSATVPDDLARIVGRDLVAW
jgi:hypothetical protein